MHLFRLTLYPITGACMTLIPLLYLCVRPLEAFLCHSLVGGASEPLLPCTCPIHDCLLNKCFKLLLCFSLLFNVDKEDPVPIKQPLPSPLPPALETY